MTRLYKDGGFVADPWVDIAEGEDPDGRPFIVPFKRWTASGPAPIGPAPPGGNVPVGVRVEAGERVEALVPDLGRLALVALVFPKFSDGRSFSKAAQLRQHGFTGEIRAVGDVLWDQMQLMRRCGFDAFAIENEPTLRALEGGKSPFMTDFYQPGRGAEAGADPHRPWARRAVTL